MPPKRNKENAGLPTRWKLQHGAYYYRVPRGCENLWDGKQMFRLGGSLPEAYKIWADRIGRQDKARTVDANKHEDKEVPRLIAEFGGEVPVDWLLKRWEQFRFVKEQIVSQACIYPPKDTRLPWVGIYFLIEGGEIRYIGKSVEIPLRLRTHTKRFKFSHVFAFKAPELLLELIEAEYIHRFMPEWNSKIPPRGLELQNAQ